MCFLAYNSKWLIVIPLYAAGTSARRAGWCTAIHQTPTCCRTAIASSPSLAAVRNLLFPPPGLHCVCRPLSRVWRLPGCAWGAQTAAKENAENTSGAVSKFPLIASLSLMPLGFACRQVLSGPRFAVRLQQHQRLDCESQRPDHLCADEPHSFRNRSHGLWIPRTRRRFCAAGFRRRRRQHVHRHQAAASAGADHCRGRHAADGDSNESINEG